MSSRGSVAKPATARVPGTRPCPRPRSSRNARPSSTRPSSPWGWRCRSAAPATTGASPPRTKKLNGPVGYEPGKALEAYFKSVSFAAGDVKDVYANEFSKGHHQQYIDWVQSKHADEGVTCTSCHFVHQIGVPPTRSQTQAAGSKQCLQLPPGDQQQPGPLHPFFCQLRGLSYAEDRHQRRIGRFPQPCLRRPAAQGHLGQPGNPQLLPDLSSSTRTRI